MRREDKTKVCHLVIAIFLGVVLLVFGTLVPTCQPAYKFLVSLVLMLSGMIVFCLIWGNAVGRPCVMSSLRNARTIIWNHLGEFDQQSP